MKEMIISNIEEELKLLRKLMVEYWKDTEDAKDGTVDIEMPYEEWVDDYIGEMLYDGYNMESIKKETRKTIAEYIEMIAAYDSKC